MQNACSDVLLNARGLALLVLIHSPVHYSITNSVLVLPPSNRNRMNIL